MVSQIKPIKGAKQKGGFIMKKLLVIVLMVLVGTFVFSSATSTAIEKFVWDGDGNVVTDPANGVYGNARVFSLLPDGGSCNKNWEFEFTTEVQVAQWSEWYISGTKWQWFVKKPGTYIADCIVFTLKSNGDIEITFEGFDDPYYVNTPDPSQTAYIETYYGYTFGTGSGDPGSVETSGSGWFRAGGLNEQTLLIPEFFEAFTHKYSLHDGITAHLWNKITVVECNSASTYRDTGIIRITLKEQKPWIDPDTGTYVDNLRDFLTDDRSENRP